MMNISKFWKNSSIRAMFIIGIGGLGFALGNILFARGLESEEYALLALVLAFSQLSMAFGPLGVDTIVNRYLVAPDRAFLLRISISSLTVSLIISGVALKFYGFSVPLTLVLVAFCVFISLNRVASALYRSRQQFRRSLLVVQSHNIMVLVVACIDLIFNIGSAFLPCVLLMMAYAVSAAWAWRKLLTEQLLDLGGVIASNRLPWREGISIVGMSAAAVFLIQLDRLTIPKFLDADALATFAVLAAIAGSPFRVLQMGVGFTLVPRLRAAPDKPARRTLILAEAAIIVPVLLAAVVFVWFITPYIVDWLLRGKYVLDGWLIAAALFAGVAKVIAGFGSAVVTAVGKSRDLTLLSVFSWSGLAVGFIGAWIGAEWGLAGIIYGVSIGWIVEILITFFLARPHILDKSAVSVS
jgi:O-antigen/teichoic acid export membrane protein